jgi:NAD(P)-dependent dehydrogenase (short-subunit alcohol dehydrogenase family)
MTTHENTVKTILITGASTGFGRATAETLARAGHRVFASMRDIGNRNKANADELRAKNIDVVELEVTSNTSVERAVSEVLLKAGRLDVVINNAGIRADRLEFRIPAWQSGSGGRAI